MMSLHIFETTIILKLNELLFLYMYVFMKNLYVHCIFVGEIMINVVYMACLSTCELLKQNVKMKNSYADTLERMKLSIQGCNVMHK